MELDLQRALKTGLLLKIEGKNLLLDFRYERLAHYCYSCGILGHYATNCQTFPCDENKLDDISFLYGSWLRAKVRTHSPFWRTFYDEEIIPETPQPSLEIIPVPDSVHAAPGFWHHHAPFLLTRSSEFSSPVAPVDSFTTNK